MTVWGLYAPALIFLPTSVRHCSMSLRRISSSTYPPNVGNRCFSSTSPHCWRVFADAISPVAIFLSSNDTA